MTGPRLHTFLRPLFLAGVFAALCIAPTQWALEIRPKTFLSPADLALAFAAGVWVLDVLATREWRRLWPLAPWPNLLFVALAFASALTATDRLSAVKDLIQYTEYFIVGHALFAAFLRDDERRLRQALVALVCVTAVVLALALVQYAGADTPALKVRGTFGNRNVLGGFLALALPLLFSAAFAVRPRGLRIALAALVLAGLTVDLSGASFFAVAVVLAGLAAANGVRRFLLVAAALIGWQVFVLPHLPRENDLVHFHSLALYSDSGTVERRYPDWQAAYSMALTHPWLGVGLGNYQKNVGQYYDNIPRQTGPSEPDIQNLYGVLAASAGFPALLVFLVLLGNAVRSALKAETRWPDNRLRTALAQGTAGALIAFAATAVWHPLLVRGIGLPLVFLLTLAYHLSESKDRNGI